MGKRKIKEIWIESHANSDHTTTIKIGTEWGCLNGFNKKDRKAVFEAVSRAMHELYPEAKINPWTDAEPGTPDFE